MSEKEIDDAMDILLSGEGERAEKLLLSLAQAGHGRAAHNLGVLYITGAPGVAPDSERAQFWLGKSYDSGFEASVASDPLWFRK